MLVPTVDPCDPLFLGCWPSDRPPAILELCDHRGISTSTYRDSTNHLYSVPESPHRPRIEPNYTRLPRPSPFSFSLPSSIPRVNATMPTPSNNRPDPPRAPHNPYIFSTCPDEQPQIDLPHPPGDWRPRSPPYENPSDAMEEDGEPSRSTTPMSPPTQSSESQDHDRTESERTVSTPTDTDDVQKPTDTDEEMSVGDVVGGSSGVDAAGGGGAPVGGSAPVQDGVSPRRTVRRPAASGSSRRRPVPDSASAARIEVDQRDGSELTMPGPLWMDDTGLLGMGYELADPRVIPISPPSYLRPGVRFHGTQQSERQRYDVQVEIKHVDLRESFLCGYLRIQGQFIYIAPFPSVLPHACIPVTQQSAAQWSTNMVALQA